MTDPRRPYRAAALLLAAGLVLSACAGDADLPNVGSTATLTAPDGTEPTAEGPPVRVNVPPFLTTGPLMIAEQEGLFEKYGVDVELVHIQSSRESFPVFAQGQIDVWYGSVEPSLINAINAGEPLALVGTGTVMDPDSCPYIAIAASPATMAERDLQTAEGWRGLRLSGVNRSLTDQRYLRALGDKLGLDVEAIETPDIDRASFLAALSSGDVDAALLYEPRTTQAVRDLGATLVHPAHELLSGPTALLGFSERLLGEPETGGRFMAAFAEGVQRFNEGPTEANIEAIAGPTEIEPDLLREMCWPTLRADGRPSEDDLTEILEFGVEVGYIDAVVPPEDLWDHRFIERGLELMEAETS